MEINEMNYELYALDYAEGRLQGRTLLAMEQFIAKHPHLEEEIFAICNVVLPKEEIVYDAKDDLLKKKRPIAIMPMAFATSSAACLILAIGLIWALNKQVNYGELAYQPVTINVLYNSVTDISIDLEDKKILEVKSSMIVESSHQKEKNGVVVSTSNFLPQTFDGSKNINNTIETKAHVNSSVVDKDINYYSTSSEKESISNAELSQLPIVELKKDSEFVIATSILVDEIVVNEQNMLIANNEALALNESATKKKALRGNVKSIFQNALLPEGITNVVNF